MLNLDNIERVSVDNIITSGVDAVARVAGGHLPPGSPRYLWSVADEVSLHQSGTTLRLPPIELFTFTNVELRSNYTPYRDGVPLADECLFPEYIKRYFDNGLAREAIDVSGVREADGAVFCVSQFNMRTYGHFLLEVFPKILLVNEMQRAGFKIPLAFPSDAGPISSIVTHICKSGDLLPYESQREILRPSAVILPSLMISSDYRGYMHNIFIALIRRLSLQFSVSLSATKLPGPKLFLSRTKWKGYRTATNEAELYDVAADYGFELVHPQDLDWSDQIRMFYGASHVISAYDSALHGTMFCQAGTRIISLGRVNGLQEGIASSLGHEIGFLHPVKGEISLYDPDAPKPQNYEIDSVQLRRRLDDLV
jgi:capsular polysaccharide biosynthesis protein